MGNAGEIATEVINVGRVVDLAYVNGLESLDCPDGTKLLGNNLFGGCLPEGGIRPFPVVEARLAPVGLFQSVVVMLRGIDAVQA